MLSSILIFCASSDIKIFILLVKFLLTLGLLNGALSNSGYDNIRQGNLTLWKDFNPGPSQYDGNECDVWYNVKINFNLVGNVCTV